MTYNQNVKLFFAISITFAIPGILYFFIRSEKPERDKRKIRDLINSLKSINTNDKKFTVPALPGRDESIVVYNRECYRYFLDFILNDDKFKRYCITGNPGIGKTYFGILLLVALLQKNFNVLIDNKDYTAYITPDGKLTPVKDDNYREYAERDNTCCIIDGVKLKVSHDFVGQKLIMVSSPKKGIVEKFMKPQNSRKFYMPTWEFGELIECREKIYHDITEDSVKEKFKLCGGIARWVFDANMSLNQIKTTLKSAILEIDLNNVIRSQAKDFSGDNFSHKVIHMDIESSDDGPYTRSLCKFASKFVENECLEKIQKDHIGDLCSFIRNSKDIKEMAVLRGKMFELWSHVKICKGGRFQIRNLSENDQPSNEVSYVAFGALDTKDFDNIKDVTSVSEGMYYQPKAENYQSIDSFTHPNILFQITISERHGIKQKGLKEYEKIFNGSEKIRLYFVVPEERFKTYKKQNYLIKNNKKAEKVIQLTEKIEQYALCMKLDE